MAEIYKFYSYGSADQESTVYGELVPDVDTAVNTVIGFLAESTTLKPHQVTLRALDSEHIVFKIMTPEHQTRIYLSVDGEMGPVAVAFPAKRSGEALGREMVPLREIFTVLYDFYSLGYFGGSNNG